MQKKHLTDLRTYLKGLVTVVLKNTTVTNPIGLPVAYSVAKNEHSADVTDAHFLII